MDGQESKPAASGVKRLLAILVLPVALYALYQGVMWGVRQYTSGLIEGVAGQQLPEFTLHGSDGKLYTKESLAGKPAVLNFFRSKCHGCREEKAEMRAFAADVHPDRATVLGIMVDEVQGFPPEVTAATLVEFGYRHPVLMADAAFVDAFHGAGWSQITPITYVVDAKGQVVRSFRYPYAIEDLRAALP